MDHAATTPLCKEAFLAMRPFLEEEYGNPSSAHSFGQRALVGADKARREAAGAIGAQAAEIFFTSGATESNNLALQGALSAWARERSAKPHLITTAIEHSSVLEVARHLEKTAQATITILGVSGEGLVSLDDVISALEENTALVSVGLANNEVGSVQPVGQIAAALAGKGILLHADASQAPSYLDCSAAALGADLVSFSGHKIYGPKGVGVLYAKEGTPIDPLFFGGRQQDGLRPGTLPAYLAVGMARALSLAQEERDKRARHARELAEYLMKGLGKVLPEARLNGPAQGRLPNNLHLSFPWGDSESTLLALDLEGVAVSTGSACASGSLQASHVLEALKIPPEYERNSLRITFGKDSTKEDADGALEALVQVSKRIGTIRA